MWLSACMDRVPDCVCVITCSQKSISSRCIHTKYKSKIRINEYISVYESSRSFPLYKNAKYQISMNLYFYSQYRLCIIWFSIHGFCCCVFVLLLLLSVLLLFFYLISMDLFCCFLSSIWFVRWCGTQAASDVAMISKLLTKNLELYFPKKKKRLCAAQYCCAWLAAPILYFLLSAK